MADPKSNLPSKILVVDNDITVANKLEIILKKFNISVIKAATWENALYLFNQNRFDMAIVDMELGEMSGTTLIQKWKRHEVESKRTTSFVISTGKAITTADEALMKELFDVSLIAKPHAIGPLLSSMANAMAAKKLNENLIEVKTKIIDPLMKHGNITKALHISREKLSPLGPKGKLITADICIAAKQYPDAFFIMKDLHENDISNMHYINELGRIKLLMGNVKEAIEYMERADKVAPNNIARLEAMSDMYLKGRMPDKSIEKMKQIMKLTPENPDVKYGFYEKLMDAGFADYAQNFCRETSTSLDLIKYYNNRGVVFSKNADYKSAIEEYVKAEKLIPHSNQLYRVLFNRAIAHINLKTSHDLMSAKILLERCLSINPGFEKAKEKLDIIANVKKGAKPAPKTEIPQKEEKKPKAV
ncbi:MAG: response regulator [Oligoflexales bacterium]|nr:response regulator [Oligoflexales bacterium]